MIYIVATDFNPLEFEAAAFKSPVGTIYIVALDFNPV